MPSALPQLSSFRQQPSTTASFLHRSAHFHATLHHSFSASFLCLRILCVFLDETFAHVAQLSSRLPTCAYGTCPHLWTLVALPQLHNVTSKRTCTEPLATSRAALGLPRCTAWDPSCSLRTPVCCNGLESFDNRRNLGDIPSLVELARDGTAVEKQFAVAALTNLACDADNQEAIAKAGAIALSCAHLCASAQPARNALHSIPKRCTTTSLSAPNPLHVPSHPLCPLDVAWTVRIRFSSAGTFTPACPNCPLRSLPHPSSTKLSSPTQVVSHRLLLTRGMAQPCRGSLQLPLCASSLLTRTTKRLSPRQAESYCL